MKEYLLEYKLSEVEKSILDLKKGVEAIHQKINSNDDLWDNSDLIREWHVSLRTLANWRKKGLISYAKVNGKIWYTKKARESFMMRNLIPSKNE